MKPRIFMCFRKADSRSTRNRVHHELVERFGPEQVFKSGSSIPPGGDYIDVLTHQAAGCEVMLVLIGPGWADLADRSGVRLLDKKEDWVRLEIGTALRSGNRVLPVLLGEAAMLPGADELPTELAPLSRRQFLRLEESRFRAGLDELVSVLAALVPDLVPVADIGRKKDPRQSAVDRKAQQRARVRDGVAMTIGGSVSDADIRVTGRDDRSRRD
jgi:hypothetical protein